MCVHTYTYVYVAASALNTCVHVQEYIQILTRTHIDIQIHMRTDTYDMY